MQIIADANKISKNAKRNLNFLLNVLCESSIYITHFQYFLLKGILEFSNKMVFIENEETVTIVNIEM